jgi:hypothetical protein
MLELQEVNMLLNTLCRYWLKVKEIVLILIMLLLLLLLLLLTGIAQSV